MSASPAVTPSPASGPSFTKEAESWLKSLGPDFKNDLEQIQKIWNHPATRVGWTLSQDQEFVSSLNQIRDSHRSNVFYAYELVLILILWTVRAWRLSKAATWLGRMWTQAWIASVFWFMALILVPGLVWGEAFRTVLSHLVRAILRHFIA